MQFMDLTVNGATMFTGQPCFNLKAIGAESYQPYSGSFFFTDTQGDQDPAFDGLNDRYLLIFESGIDGSNSQIPLQAVPSQSLTLVADSQNIAINLYEEVIDTRLVNPLPIGADEGYIRQQFLSPLAIFVVLTGANVGTPVGDGNPATIPMPTWEVVEQGVGNVAATATANVPVLWSLVPGVATAYETNSPWNSTGSSVSVADAIILSTPGPSLSADLTFFNVSNPLLTAEDYYFDFQLMADSLVVGVRMFVVYF